MRYGKMCSARTSVTRKPCRMARAEANAVLQTEHGGAGAGQLHGLVGKVHGGDLGAGAGEVNGIGADAAADLENLFAAPARELRECRYVILHKVFARLDLVEVFLRADRRGGMADVAGTLVPIIPDARDFHFGEIHKVVHVSARGSTCHSHVYVTAPYARPY